MELQLQRHNTALKSFGKLLQLPLVPLSSKKKTGYRGRPLGCTQFVFPKFALRIQMEANNLLHCHFSKHVSQTNDLVLAAARK